MIISFFYLLDRLYLLNLFDLGEALEADGHRLLYCGDSDYAGVCPNRTPFDCLDAGAVTILEKMLDLFYLDLFGFWVVEDSMG